MVGIFCMKSDGAVCAPPALEGHSSSAWLRRQKGSASLAALTPPALPGWPDALVEMEGGESWRIPANRAATAKNGKIREMNIDF